MGDYETDNATEEELAAMPSGIATDSDIPDQTAEVLEVENNGEC
jgi:hypothetical protein